jgi:UPF0176 protein
LFINPVQAPVQCPVVFSGFLVILPEIKFRKTLKYPCNIHSTMKNILFYKFTPIKNIKAVRDAQFELCKDLGLFGKVVLAEEGVNGCLSGMEDCVEDYMKETQALLGPIEFKVTEASDQDFRRLWVKIKPQIITTRVWDAKIENKGDYIEPEELKELLDKGEDVVIVDARNGFEFDFGRFKGSISPDIKKFSEFPKVAEKLKGNEDKKIVTYCTGGIRCEKASAYLKEQGFKNVYQLHGGIIKYGQKVGNDHWEGKCFVFDKRETVDF